MKIIILYFFQQKKIFELFWSIFCDPNLDALHHYLDSLHHYLVYLHHYKKKNNGVMSLNNGVISLKNGVKRLFSIYFAIFI